MPAGTTFVPAGTTFDSLRYAHGVAHSLRLGAAYSLRHSTAYSLSRVRAAGLSGMARHIAKAPFTAIPPCQASSSAPRDTCTLAGIWSSDLGARWPRHVDDQDLDLRVAHILVLVGALRLRVLLDVELADGAIGKLQIEAGLVRATRPALHERDASEYEAGYGAVTGRLRGALHSGLRNWLRGGLRGRLRGRLRGGLRGRQSVMGVV